MAEDDEYDVVLSGFAIHHQPDARKRELYAEIFALLRPGGMFLHLEHVASVAVWGEQAFEDLMVDRLLVYHCQQGETVTREEIATRFVQRKDWSANILAPVDQQCRWLRDIGFVDVDCFFKALELALFGGRKPDRDRLV